MLIVCAAEPGLLIAAAAARGIALVAGDRDGALAEPAAAGIVLGSVPGRFGDTARWIGRARAAGQPLGLVALVDDDEEMIGALDAGADDAIPLHCAPEVAAARLAALLRRLRRDRAITIGDLVLDPAGPLATHGGRPLALQPREYALLLYLARAAGRTVTRAELLAGVWALRFEPGTKLIEVHVSRLRAKLEAGGAARLLHTERGRGYRLAP